MTSALTRRQPIEGGQGQGIHSGVRSEGVSLVIPAYNEADRIRSTLERYLRCLRKLSLPFEIIVVIDGTDNTLEVVESLKSADIRVIRSGTRLGKGGGIIAGFRAAGFTRVGYVDADGSLAEESLVTLIERVGEFDCVFGSRWVEGAQWRARESLGKEIAGRVFNSFIRALLGIDVRDTQCGAKFYSADTLRTLLPAVYVNDMTTDVSFVFHAKRIGARCAEIPVVWTNHQDTHFDLIVTPGKMFLTVIGMRVANSRARHFIPSSFVTRLQRAIHGS